MARGVPPFRYHIWPIGIVLPTYFLLIWYHARWFCEANIILPIVFLKKRARPDLPEMYIWPSQVVQLMHREETLNFQLNN